MNTILIIELFCITIVFAGVIKFFEKIHKKDRQTIKEIEEEKKTLKNSYKEKIKNEVIYSAEKATIEANRKIREAKQKRKERYQENIKKGRDYELFISEYFKDKGYQVKKHGLIEGRKDKGIDIIIKKDKDITLIQCKNWKRESKYKIKHKHLKEFLGNGLAFIELNKEKAKDYNIKYMFVASNDILDGSAIHFLRNNKALEYKVIPFKAELNKLSNRQH